MSHNLYTHESLDYISIITCHHMTRNNTYVIKGNSGYRNLLNRNILIGLLFEKSII